MAMWLEAAGKECDPLGNRKLLCTRETHGGSPAVVLSLRRHSLSVETKPADLKNPLLVV